MKLIYSPSYTGLVYFGSKELLFDTKIVDTAGLVETIRLYAGLNQERKDNITRVADYYKAMKTYMEKNPDNVLAASFSVDALNVAKECLTWRDNLAFAGWNKNADAPSARMEVLKGIEEFFDDKSLGEDLSEIIEDVKNGCILPNPLEIETLVDYNLFSPLEKDFLLALKSRGVSIVKLATPERKNNALSQVVAAIEKASSNKVHIERDDSFEIFHFEEQDESMRYLSLLPPDAYKVWINSDNKVLDNWLYLEGKPLSGSEIKGGVPQITQLLPIGLGIFARPMNIKNMIEWLNVPLSPFPQGFRKKLEAKIAREGGFYNTKCEEIVAAYVSCKKESESPDYKDDIKKESKCRESLVKKFLPSFEKTEDVLCENVDVSVERVRNFTSDLYSWCGEKIVLIEQESVLSQLAVVRKECEALLRLLDSETMERMSLVKLMALVYNLKNQVNAPQYEAEKGARFVISEPGHIASSTESLIWCDFYNENEEKLKYDFLSPSEKEFFKQSLKLWDEATECEYNHSVKMLPFLFAQKVALVIVDKKINEKVDKHPIIIQLEKVMENINDFVSSPQMNADHGELLSDVKILDNGMDESAEGIQIDRADLIKWPDQETYSSLNLLVYNPFDYAFDTLAKISSCGQSSLQKINQVKGIVAHAVIETLFNKNDDVKGSGTVPFIKEKIKNEFDHVFADVVNANGAILLLKENILNLESYKNQVYSAVNSLVNVLEQNKLHVLACEPWLDNKEMGFDHNITIGGYADMILADEGNNPIVFDFKWSSGKKDKFEKTIKENKSIQLELYKYLTKELAGSNAKSVAYVILPEVIVISAHHFEGKNVIKVNVENEEELLLTKIKNSYEYRRKQISSGFIEEATDFAPDDIAYQRDVDTSALMPLEFKNKKKPPKDYPKYEIFKGRKGE